MSVFADEPVLTSTTVAAKLDPDLFKAAKLGIPEVVEAVDDVTDPVTSAHHILNGQVWFCV